MPQAHIDYYDHPVFNPTKFYLETDAISHLREVVRRWVWNGITGGVILGPPRVGKSKAALSIVSKISTRGNKSIPVCYVPIPKRDGHTIKFIFRQLCWSQGIRFNRNLPTDFLSEHFLHYVDDQITEAGVHSAVLIVDEMQRLRPDQFNAFAEVYDKLLLVDIVLTTVFFGNEQECDRLFKQIEQPEYDHIRGRFFRQREKFTGITSKNEVHSLLEQYDQLCYPPDGPTYTAYFLPQAFRNGWRFASLSDDLWRIFREYQKNYKINSWGMQYFTIAVNTLLTDYLPRFGVEKFEDDMFHECIRISGLVPSLVKRSH